MSQYSPFPPADDRPGVEQAKAFGDFLTTKAEELYGYVEDRAVRQLPVKVATVAAIIGIRCGSIRKQLDAMMAYGPTDRRKK